MTYTQVPECPPPADVSKGRLVLFRRVLRPKSLSEAILRPIYGLPAGGMAGGNGLFVNLLLQRNAMQSRTSGGFDTNVLDGIPTTKGEGALMT